MLVEVVSGRADIARRAFDAVAAAQNARTLEELDHAVAPACEALGFSHFMCVDISDQAARPKVAILFGRPPHDWMSRYLELGIEKYDPILREAMASHEPFFWTDVIDRRPDDAYARKIFAEAAMVGLTNAFLTPIRNLDRSISAVALLGRDIDHRNSDLRAAAHLLSLYYGAIGRRLHATARRQAGEVPSLTARQRECLQWVRAGKSSEDIGGLLGISADTVNHHIAVACQKLGVRTRVQAVAEAALLGLIEL